MKRETLSRLSLLGFDSYADYLASPIWLDFRRRYFASGFPKTCLVCNSREVTLHHITYRRLGNEKFSDVLPLCWPHHEAVHKWLRKRRMSVELTRLAVNALASRRESS